MEWTPPKPPPPRGFSWENYSSQRQIMLDASAAIRIDREPLPSELTAADYDDNAESRGPTGTGPG